MTIKRPALGRGLGALIDDSKYEKKTVEEVISTGSITEIDIENIEVNPFQPRTHFDEEALGELAASIRELGIIQPITVRKLAEGSFQLISGERRFRASKIAGLKAIPAFVRDVNDQSMLELALVENIQREDLDAIEIAITYQRLIDECTLTQEALSERVGKKRSSITNYLRLLRLPAEIQAGIRDKRIAFGHAKALINIEDKEKQLNLFKRTIEEELSVRDTEKYAREINNPTPVVVIEPIIEPVIEPVIETITPINQEIENREIDLDVSHTPLDVEVAKKQLIEIPLPDYHVNIRENLMNYFQTYVDVRRDEKGKGKLIIPFESDAEFSRIAEILKKLDR